jgi:hypothetical protein
MNFPFSNLFKTLPYLSMNISPTSFGNSHLRLPLEFDSNLFWFYHKTPKITKRKIAFSSPPPKSASPLAQLSSLSFPLLPQPASSYCRPSSVTRQPNRPPSVSPSHHHGLAAEQPQRAHSPSPLDQLHHDPQAHPALEPVSPAAAFPS